MDPLTPDDDAAWARVTSRWDDDEAHRAFLATHAGLDGLAEAGRRYREVLDARPDDAVALRWRDEVLRRATALAFAQLPRSRPPRETPRGARRAALALLAAAVAGATAWLALRLGAAR